MISDTELLLNEFLGDDFAQSVSAEMGQSITALIWLSGFQACHRLTMADLELDDTALANEVESSIDALFRSTDEELIEDTEETGGSIL